MISKLTKFATVYNTIPLCTKYDRRSRSCRTLVPRNINATSYLKLQNVDKNKRKIIGNNF